MPETVNTTAANDVVAAPSDAERRDELRKRIEAGEKRNETRRLADQARDVADSAFDYAKKNPLKVVAGGIAVGLAIGALTRPGRRLGKRGGALAALATDAAIAYGLKMLDRAGNAASGASDSAATTAQRIAKDASYRLDIAGDAVRDGSRKAGAMGKRAMREISSRFTH